MRADKSFGQPVGIHISPKNRWVKRVESIPWDKIEHRYAEFFKNRKGNVAKPLRLALGLAASSRNMVYSDKETALQIKEGAYLQFFAAFQNTNTSNLLTHR